MSGKATLTYYDSKGKPTSMTVNTVDIDSTSITAQTAALAALRSAITAISNSTEIGSTLSVIESFGTPANRGGLRGVKALVRWFSADEGDGGQYGSNEIGCIDESEFTIVGDKAVLQGTLYDNLKAAFDAFVVTENGNSVAVYEVEQVTRGI